MIDINIKNTKIPETFVQLSKIIYPGQVFSQDNQEEIDYLFSAQNSFFSTGKSAYKIIDEKLRVVLFYDSSNSYKNKKAAYFGYWESINEPQLNKVAFSECEKWAKKQGAELLIGPINFNTYNKYRLNTTPNNTTNFLNEPNNPNYYPELLSESGFTVLNEYLSYEVKDKSKINKWYEIYNKKKDLLKFEDYSFKFITPELWLEKIEEIHKMSELVFGDNFAYSPVDLKTFKTKYGTFFPYMICSKTSLFAFDKNNNIIGTIINFPNYLSLIEQGLPLTSFNYKSYTDAVQSRTLLLKTVGMVKEHSHMGYLLIAMLLKIIPNALKHYDDYVFCLMQKGNYPSLLGKEFSDFTKTYALYVKELKVL
jgi:hypothetical protein